MAPSGAETLTVAMPYENPKRDMSTTYCEQNTFMGYHPQIRMHTL
jgi:hypothetical protein